MSDRIVEFVNYEDIPVFRVTYNPGRRYIFDASVEEVNGWNVDDRSVAEDFEPYGGVLIKSDSCSYFTPVNGQLHFCGVIDYKRHIALLEWLYKKAFEVMGQEPDSDERW